jgi:FkbM family methyltransferase
MNKREKTLTLRKILDYALIKLWGNSSHRKYPKIPRSINANSRVLNGMVAYNKYGGYFTPISSQQRPAVQKILNGTVYEPETISYIRDNCSKGDIIHAGTFFGDFLPGISSALAAEAKIWAFEPNTENFQCAKITCMINQLGNVNLFNAGLGDRKTKSQMVIKSVKGINLGGESYISNKKPEGETIDIDIVKIDDIIPSKREISILQLDVEGYEKQALIGAMETIKRNRPIIILEDNNNIIESDWFNHNILTLGYYKTKRIHGNTVFKSKIPHNT